MKSIKELLSDGEQLSSYRVAMFLVLIPGAFVWTWLSIKRGDFIVPDNNTLYVLMTIFGGKALQSFAERLPSKPDNESSIPKP